MKNLRIKTYILFLLCIVPFIYGCQKREVIELDSFSDIQIEEKGWNKAGYLKVDKGNISYDGKDETVKKLIDSIWYEVKPNKNLKNGDVVDIEVRYDNSLFKRVNVKFTKEKEEYKVSKLIEKDSKIITKEEIINKNGEEKKKYTQYMIIEGVEVPTAWHLSDEEIQEYIQYIKQLEQNPNASSELDRVEWNQGVSDTETHRSNSKFYLKEYGNKDLDCYNASLEYGQSSSQKYKIVPIIKNNQTIGYECIFKK